MQDTLNEIAQFGDAAAAFRLAFTQMHNKLANNMAGGRNMPDIGVQYPSNPNMMQMNQVGNKGTIPNNPNTTQPSLTPTQPGTAITQPVQTAANQVNPSTQPHAPGSPQHTPLQNIKGTIYSAHNPPSVRDNTPPPARRMATKLEDLAGYRTRGDWHNTNDWDLELHDELGGHSGKHIYATWEETANRMLRFGSANRINNASSRFIDPTTANRFAHETLKANSAKIEKWLTTNSNKRDLQLVFRPANNEVAGFSILRNSKNFIATYKVKMVLIKTGNNSYRIKTFYPYHK